MRIGRIAVRVAAGGAAAVTGASAWVVAERMLATPAEALRNEVPDPDAWVHVVRVEGDRVVLDGPGAARAGVWGLAWADGYAQVGDVAGREDGGVVRPVRGLPALPEQGTEALLDVDAYPADPSVLGLPWEEVDYHSPAGRLPAWVVPAGADDGTWAILVHGRSGTRRQGLKLVPALHAAGATSMLISYRGDHDAADLGDGMNHLGAAEWADVEGAVVHALARGARDVVLVGASMGATAVLTFLRTSSHAGHVRAAVLDAPVLDWPDVLRRSLWRRGVPTGLAAPTVLVAQGIARVRAGIDWDAVDHLRRSGDLRHPLLVLHGDADLHVPVEASEELARRRADLVRLHRVPGAGHIAAWNLDPVGVEAAITEFLATARTRGGKSVADRARGVLRAARRTMPGR